MRDRVSRELLAGAEPAQAARVLREVCANFPTGITIVTSCYDEGPKGITVNSFTSVSLEPPLVLVCIDRRSSSCASIAASGRFAVHFLAADQFSWARLFARPGDGKFDGLAWTVGDHGVPLLPRFAAALECELVSEYEGGDHAIFVGEVKSSHAGDRGGAVLGFFRGRFVRVDRELGLFEEVIRPGDGVIGMQW